MRNQYSPFFELQSQSLNSADSESVFVFEIGALEICFITIHNLKVANPIFLGHPGQVLIADWQRA